MHHNGDVVARDGRSAQGTPTPQHWVVDWEINEWCRRLWQLGRCIGDVGVGLPWPTASSLIMLFQWLKLECNGSPLLPQDQKAVIIVVHSSDTSHHCDYRILHWNQKGEELLHATASVQRLH